jgi:hypothetical protein
MTSSGDAACGPKTSSGGWRFPSLVRRSYGQSVATLDELPSPRRRGERRVAGTPVLGLTDFPPQFRAAGDRPGVPVIDW